MELRRPVSARHIAILVTALGAGGAERVIGQLCAHWHAAGRRLTVITFDGDDDEIYHPLPEGVELVRLDCKGGGVATIVRKVVRLRKALARIEPDVLVSFLTKNNLIAGLAGHGLKNRWVACERNNPELQQSHPLWNRLLRHVYRRSDAIICQTRGVKRCFPVALRDRLVVINNPVAEPDFKAGKGAKTVAGVGRLDRQKGFDVLVAAFAQVAPRHPDWCLDIWGDGCERDKLQGLIDRRGMGERITLRGVSETPGAWTGETEIFVLSSRYEGFPNVLGEAMAAGLPPISTRCEFGPEEMLHNGTSGLLVPVDQVGQLSGAIETLIAHEEMRDRLGEEARKAAAAFAPERILPQWDRVVDRVCASRNGHAAAQAPAEGVLAQR